MISFSTPGDLGISHRVPGVLPYIQFILHSVFLRFDTRGYRIPGQQWQVAAGALRVFYLVGLLQLMVKRQILQQYQMQSEDFSNETFVEIQGKRYLANKSSGTVN